MRSLRVLALIPLAVLLVAPAPTERPHSLEYAGFVDLWKALYPESSSADNLASTPFGACSLCHKTTHTWNGYGWQMVQEIANGASPTEALLAIEASNADHDPTGASSLAEIRADAQPGWTPGANNTIYYHGGVSQNQEPPAGITGRLDPPCDSVASTVFRNGSGVNPACFASSTPPALGTAWRIAVDASLVPAATATAVLAHTRGGTGPVFEFGELLLDTSSPVVFVLVRTREMGSVHTIELPTWPTLLGFHGTVQGAILAGGLPVQLCNAEDFIMGCRP